MAKEITLQSPKIDRLINQVETGEIKVPPLQRPFVWSTEQIIQLLESIYNDYPIGSLLLWETTEPLPSARNIAGFKIPNKPESYPFFYVLDGQQRLSSLYGVFCKTRESENTGGKYSVDHNVFDIFFLINEEKFIHRTSYAGTGTYLELKTIFDAPNFHKCTSVFTDEEKAKAIELLSRFSNYEIPQIITKKRDLGEVGIIFERVNNTGTKLDIFDLMVAITWTKNFHLQEAFTDIFKLLASKGFHEIKNKIILQCLSVVIEESASVKSIIKLKPELIRENILVLKNALAAAVDYLSTELNVRSVDLLPHAHQIIGLTYFFSKKAKLSASDKKIINQWFWKTSFSDRYSASTDSKIDEDVQAFKAVIFSGLDNFKKLSYSVSIEQLKNTRFSRSNSFSRAFVVLLSRSFPKDLTNGVSIDTGVALASFNNKEYHHVFPKAYLKKLGMEDLKINCISNICMLPSASNKLISDKNPSDYFDTIVPPENFVEILESNLLPVNKQLYEQNDFSGFLDERSRKIIEFINKQIA